MAKQIIPERVCPHCGGTEWNIRTTSTGYTRYDCVLRVKESNAKYRKENKDKTYALHRKYMDNPVNKARANKRARELYAINKESKRQKAKKYRESAPGYREKRNKEASNRRLNLTDGYLRSIFGNSTNHSRIPAKDISPQLLEQYRQIVKLRRLCQQLKLRSRTIPTGQIPLEIATSIVRGIMGS